MGVGIFLAAIVLLVFSAVWLGARIAEASGTKAWKGAVVGGLFALGIALMVFSVPIAYVP